MQRVADRVVILTWDPEDYSWWLVDEYLPETATDDLFAGPTLPAVDEALGATRVETVMIPVDCQDAFYAVVAGRAPRRTSTPPSAMGISCCSLLDQTLVAERMHQLEADLTSGTWDRRHPTLRTQPEADAGYRLIISTSRATRAVQTRRRGQEREVDRRASWVSAPQRTPCPSERAAARSWP